ncbi:MAG: DUF6037 family protein, partial [Helcococcus sp.]|nr:DUF6037 family protein [Helcococcus sp.]
MHLKNLKSLRDDMLKKGWVISSFLFKYNKNEYIVLVHLFNNIRKKKSPYALVLLEFLEKNNLDYNLQVEANSNGLLIDAKELRNYFRIKYSPNLGDILTQFTDELNKHTPTVVTEKLSEEQTQVMSFSLSKSDSENPNKKYCFAVKRNPKGYSRSDFNDNKTRLLRPRLYKYFKDDKTISFCFSDAIENKKTDS